MRVVPLTLREANTLVAELHRHHKPVRLWSISSGIKRTVSDAEKARRRELALERGFGQKT